MKAPQNVSDEGVEMNLKNVIFDAKINNFDSLVDQIDTQQILTERIVANIRRESDAQRAGDILFGRQSQETSLTFKDLDKLNVIHGL